MAIISRHLNDISLKRHSDDIRPLQQAMSNVPTAPWQHQQRQRFILHQQQALFDKAHKKHSQLLYWHSRPG